MPTKKPANCFVASACSIKFFFTTTTTSRPCSCWYLCLNVSLITRLSLFLSTASLTFLFATTMPSLACCWPPVVAKTENELVFLVYKGLAKTFEKLPFSVILLSNEKPKVFTLIVFYALSYVLQIEPCGHLQSSFFL